MNIIFEKKKRIEAGAAVKPRELVTIHVERIRVPDRQRLVHLQFRRFAGCPVCDLHLHSILRRHGDIQAASIREVVVFHSTATELLRHAGDLPFAVIADPDQRLYAEFGVEAGRRALLDPRAWAPILRGVFRSLRAILAGRPVPPLNPLGGRFGLPAEFLIASDGRVLACKYGSHAYDQWSVDEILAPASLKDTVPDVNRGNSVRMLRAAKQAAVSAAAIFAVTTVHHVYGAYVYHTAWRVHAALISGLSTALIAALFRLMRKRPGNAAGVAASWAFIGTTVLVPFLGFGAFEGAYNHVLKDALYFARASPQLMARLFPPPAYEMPNNAFFEITGVMQVLPGFLTGYYLYRFVQSRRAQ